MPSSYSRSTRSLVFWKVIRLYDVSIVHVCSDRLSNHHLPYTHLILTNTSPDTPPRYSPIPLSILTRRCQQDRGSVCSARWMDAGVEVGYLLKGILLNPELFLSDKFHLTNSIWWIRFECISSDLSRSNCVISSIQWKQPGGADRGGRSAGDEPDRERFHHPRRYNECSIMFLFLYIIWLTVLQFLYLQSFPPEQCQSLMRNRTLN